MIKNTRHITEYKTFIYLIKHQETHKIAKCFKFLSLSPYSSKNKLFSLNFALPKAETLTNFVDW